MSASEARHSNGYLFGRKSAWFAYAMTSH